MPVHTGHDSISCLRNTPQMLRLVALSHRAKRVGVIVGVGFDCACQTKVYLLSRFDKASCSHDILGSASILLHVKLVVHDVLVVHSKLELEKCALSNESRTVHVIDRWHISIASILLEIDSGMGLFLRCDKLELIRLEHTLVVEQR